jgi:hypothetical protein
VVGSLRELRMVSHAPSSSTPLTDGFRVEIIERGE